ncbi:hypothetical protein E4631_19420 [Hymenobacter sp. UV11]|jgi:hypothetical protein|uniref:hypothetical protein n=1 Tax=Hymenobacter sp. UV11 TaxID=1849735 RepID=UPI0010606914|nr:hypothetical protein [Hymenobacter sp. UV11]TDN37053.1 hypothetical protein A8B98_06610 [Hymenobacter sp. UV11]TFZ64177.1 hypothetical protein E4631_19420 [Hymenobacter sp. UV11]
MRILTLLPVALAVLLASSCSQAQSDSQEAGGADKASKGKHHKKKTKQKDEAQASPDGGAEVKKAGGDPHFDAAAAAAIPGLRTIGSLAGVVPENSGLVPAEQAGAYYSFGDVDNPPRLFKFDLTGHLLGTVDIAAPNNDWESISRDGQGNYYICDCGNNHSDRRNLALYRVRPDQPRQVGSIRFTYPDQTEFPPAKKVRSFDCEASLWHAGKIWLFTKDLAQKRTSTVYTVPDRPGQYTAQRMTSLAIPGEVTDAALSPNGHRLVLLGRGELFLLDGNSWEDILKATPRRVDLTGAGQTEAAYFKDDRMLLLTTEQGAIYEYTLP